MGFGERGMMMRVLTHKGGRGAIHGKMGRGETWKKKARDSGPGRNRWLTPTEALRERRLRLLTEWRQGIGNTRQQQGPKEQ